MKRFKWTLFIVLCLALMSVGTLAHAQQKEVKLTAWTHDHLYLDYFNSRLPEWEAAHPDTKFTYDFQVNSNVNDAVLTALAAGEPIPDLVGIEQAGFPRYMKDDIISTYFVDLTDLVGEDAKLYAEGRWATYASKGRYFAVESQLPTTVYYYQPAIFEKAGVEVPKTWEELLNDVGPKLAANGSAFSFATNDGSWFTLLFWQRGGAVFDKDGKFVFGDEPNKQLAIEVADYAQKAVKAGIFLPVLGGDVWSGATIPTAYKDGKLAGTMMPDWWSSCCLKPGIPEMSGQWRIAPPPMWESGGSKTTVWGGTGWAVSKGANQDIAWEFLKFMYLGKESQIQRFEKINMFPTMFEAMTDPRVTGLTDPFYGDEKIGEVYAAIAPDVPVWYQSPYRADWMTAAANDLPGLFDGSMTPQAFVEDIITQTQSAIDFGS